MKLLMRRFALSLLAALLALTPMTALAQGDVIVPAQTQPSTQNAPTEGAVTAKPQSAEATGIPLATARPTADTATVTPAQTPALTPQAEPTASLDPDAVKYVALTISTLKMRRTPENNAMSIGSVAAGETVYLIDVQSEWATAKKGDTVYYLYTKYLENIREYDEASAAVGDAVEHIATPTADTLGALAMDDQNGFQSKYYAYGYKRSAIYQQKDITSRRIGTVPTYEQCVVSYVDGDWCYVRYGKQYGYVLCDSLFKWDRIDPYAGEIPGLVVYPQLAFVNKITHIYSAADHSILKTINPGSAVCVQELDAMGRYPLPYWRTTGYIKQEDVAYLLPVVPYEEAKPGDLISTMTTFFAVGERTLMYQGRNWNIYLSSSMISGTVLQPGESFVMNECIGPYSKSTGYHEAPIMSPTALSGYGGGTCQVNTTFYITNIQVPILITHRKVHADVGIYYCKVGFDAAVGGGDINLSLTNTLPFAIRYQFFISDGVLTCCIFREN
ncbi:MAG: VanW family protein [Clostridia bacterium]